METREMIDLKKQIAEMIMRERQDKYNWCPPLADQIFAYLASKGVCVKVEAIRECADEDGCPREYKANKYVPLSELMKEQE